MMSNDNRNSATTMAARLDRLRIKALALWDYCSGGVWQDTRSKWWISLVKVANLTVRGFLNGDLQNKACAMTFRTILALVPFLALLFAIGRGFGLGDYLQNEILGYLPSQRQALETAFRFVDSYLAQASEGIFVGVGILFLLWTLISLLSSVEEVFNKIWNVRSTRTLWRKLADYTAILLFLPILMICSSGITIFMTTALHRLFDFGFLSPLVSHLLDVASIALSWLFFAGCYALIPNAKVKFLNALIAGVLAGTGFQILQWLFVTGQMYVAKYNAIYGSFSFLPLMLIWMQLVWLITFIGAGVCFSSQNIFRYSFENQINKISISYRTKVMIAILTVIIQRFKDGKPPVNSEEIVAAYGLPPRLVDDALATLLEINLICHVINPDNLSQSHANIADLPYQPTHPVEDYSVGALMTTLDNHGASDFIPGFASHFEAVDKVVATIEHAIANGEADVRLTDIPVA